MANIQGAENAEGADDPMGSLVSAHNVLVGDHTGITKTSKPSLRPLRLCGETDQTPTIEGLRALEMYASNSDLNFWIPLTTGAAQESLSTQIVFPVMFSERSSSRSRSSAFPFPARMRSSTLVVHAVPSWHWVHWAQDSWA